MDWRFTTFSIPRKFREILRFLYFKASPLLLWVSLELDFFCIFPVAVARSPKSCICSTIHVPFYSSPLSDVLHFWSLIPITWGGNQYPWSSWHTLVPLIIGAEGLIGFVVYEFLIATKILFWYHPRSYELDLWYSLCGKYLPWPDLA